MHFASILLGIVQKGGFSTGVLVLVGIIGKILVVVVKIGYIVIEVRVMIRMVGKSKEEIQI